MPASYTIRRSVPRNTRRSKPASTPSTCFPSFSINLFMAFPLPLVICLPTQQTSYGNRKRHHRLVAAMPRYVPMMGQYDGDVAEGARLAVAFHVGPPPAGRQGDGVLAGGMVIQFELLQPLGQLDALLPLVVVCSFGQVPVGDR